jgi:hypothetical protein
VPGPVSARSKMFPWRKKEKREADCDEKPARAARVPKHLGDVWHILQEIAREEDASFEKKSIVEHFNSCAEGMRDVERWLRIYEHRRDPGVKVSFPPHIRRHRGYCLVARNWPQGLSWDAFREETGFRAPLPRCPDEQSLIAALEEYLRQASAKSG